jgi:RNA-binding protein
VKSIGLAVHAIGARILVVRCDAAQLPRLYSEVIDRRMKPVGRVVDVFGNVATPLAAVLCKGPCTVAAGEKLFIR